MLPLALRKGPGAFRKWLFVGLGVSTFGLYGVAFVVDRFGQHERAVPSDVLVVLGARVLPGGQPSPALRARIEKAQIGDVVSFVIGGYGIAGRRFVVHIGIEFDGNPSPL